MLFVTTSAMHSSVSLVAVDFGLSSGSLCKSSVFNPGIVSALDVITTLDMNKS